MKAWIKAWILAGLISLATAPLAAASEDVMACQLDETRRAAQERMDAPTPPANVTVGVRSTVVARDVTENAVREAPRRRSGKRIPDAELIGPRGAL